MQYDENGKPLYNFKVHILEMNVISFAQTDKYATNTYRVLVNPYVPVSNIGQVHFQSFLMIIQFGWNAIIIMQEHGNGK